VTTGATSGEFLSGDALEGARRRSTRLIVGGSALGSVGHIAAVTVVAIAARELLDDASLAGASTTTIIIGSALGASLLSWLMVRRGRRTGLSLGLAIAVLGGLIATWSVISGSFLLLLMGTLLFGFGNSSMQLSRYAAADMAPAKRRAWVIGLVVWGATVGAIVGPNIVPLAASAAESLGVAELAGPLLLGTVFLGLTGLLWFARLRPDPYQLAEASSRIDDADASTAEPLTRILRRPSISTAIIAMVVGQVVMVGIMTMTPLHMREHGHELAAVGLVISAHTAGMFAFSPITGRIVQRFGSIATILAGAAVLATATVLAASAPPDGGLVLLVALFLLGYGWNLGFVAGSTLLVSGVEHAERTRIEGVADSLVWGSSALASLASGFILAGAGYSALGIAATFMLVLPVAAVLRGRRASRNRVSAAADAS